MGTKGLKFYAAFWVVLIGGSFVFLFICFKFLHFHLQLVEEKGENLVEFTRRMASRIEANPAKFQDPDDMLLGNRKLQLVASYENLLKAVPYAPSAPDILFNNKINIALGGINGLFSIASFSIIYPTEIEGHSYYSIFRFSPDFNEELMEIQFTLSLQPVVFTSASIITLLFLWQVLYAFKMDTNLRKLADWAHGISLSKATTSPPQLAGKSLNPLATMMNKSLQAFNNVLEQEHSFAKFTSHELRTQVTILSVNMEILDTIMADLKPSERKVLYRMEQVVSDMKYQTEALLWISKEVKHELEYSECPLLDMINKSIEDNRYLLDNKDVEIDVTGIQRSINSHPPLLQIAFNNLIRNAAQNTINGEIHVHLDECSLTIINQEKSDDSNASNSDGFGIGLVMVKKIMQRLNIKWHTKQISNGFWVKLNL